MSLEIPSEITEDWKKNQIYNVIVKMKNSVEKFYSSLDTAKEEINWKIDQKKLSGM